MTTLNYTDCADHSGYRPRIEIQVRRFGEVTEANTTRFTAVAGGRRTLSVGRCRCAQTTTYTLREEGADSRAVEDDVEAVTAALHEVLAQPDADVFILDLVPNRPVSVIVPRHHLPLFIVERKP